ncbi:lysophospholipase L1-like esterase [Actinoplanes octamycinicus]|uniref:Lysophospholipase L1-like esterase n=1 Tax=Actinoplanes octamycinicus TaxID=135948 RepID=A0A7W7GYT1_9ACTN|nr:SGNH/GDSL hydrolase family protein [Actinoplanes octamycinicus]MBB4740758.1 lysophospholipase L1-like esterase [Actinoplanes octamycinicus]GIE61704.1 SGNH hydrolase [Actinoplanes octamycinicus]
MRRDLLPDLGRATTRRALIFGGAAAAALVATPGIAGPLLPARARQRWTGTWATANTATERGEKLLPADRTVRQVVHLSVGGVQPRLRLSNEFGATPVRLGEIWTGLRAGGPDSTAFQPATMRPVTFGGRAGVLLPAGGALVSDPVPGLTLPPGADLVITYHLPEATRIGTVSTHAYQRNRILPGNVAAVADPAGGKVSKRYLLLGGVSVRTAGPSAAVVAFGDSITCGASTTLGANHRWPDHLAARLRAAGLPLGVLNAGINGNRLLVGPDIPVPAGGGGSGAGAPGRAFPLSMGPAGLRRLDRDALDQPGARYLITLIGVNDIGHGTAAAPMIAGHLQLIARARQAGFTVIGGTLLPFGGSVADAPATRLARSTLNDWIRRSGEYDAVIDFDAAVRDGAYPERLWPGYDSGDHLHPNDAGMLAIASAVPLGWFR